MGKLTTVKVINLTSTFLHRIIIEVVGALNLLTGETNGFSFDATTANHDNFTFRGGPYAGTVAVKDTTTPANNLSDVALDLSNITNAGTSPKMVPWGESPYMRWTPHNFQPSSQVLFTGTLFAGGEWSWGEIPVVSGTITDNATTAPDGTVTGAQIDCTVTGDDYFRGDLHGSTFYTFNTVSVYLKRRAGTNWVVVYGLDSGSADNWFTYFNLATGTIGSSGHTAGGQSYGGIMEDAGNGWYRCSTIGYTNAQTAIQIQFATGDGTPGGVVGDSIYAWGAQLNYGYIPTPYIKTTSTSKMGIPQSYDIDRTKYGMLIEPAATNLLIRSIDFSATWVQTDTTRTSTTNLSPENATNATLLTEGVAGTASNKQAITITANGTYTISIFLKRGNTDFIRLGFYETATTTNRIDNWFDLSDGTMGTPANGGTGSGATGSITSIDGSWYRCVLTGAINNGATAVTVDMSSASADGSSTRVNSATYYAWGGQAEVDDICTSFVFTQTSTATRAVDNVSALGTSFGLTNGPGTLYVDCKRRYGSTTAPNALPRYLMIHDGSLSNVVSLEYELSTPQEQFNTLSGGVAQGPVAASPGISANARIQFSAAWNTNDLDATVNGGVLNSDNTATNPTGLTTMLFGDRFGNDRTLSGFIYRMVWVPRQVQTASGNLVTWRFNF